MKLRSKPLLGKIINGSRGKHFVPSPTKTIITRRTEFNVGAIRMAEAHSPARQGARLLQIYRGIKENKPTNARA